jgi:hypothetical protein
MSWPPSDDDESAASARDDGAAELKDLAAFMVLTSTSVDVLKNYERIDGTPVVPGVDWGKPTAQRDKLWQKFRKTTLRNARKAVQRRKKYPPKHDKHRSSLPLDYSPLRFIRLRLNILRSARQCAELPEWTKADYESQFSNSNMSSVGLTTADLLTLANLLCDDDIGKSTLLGAKTHVEGKYVDYHVELDLTESGHYVGTLGHTHMHIARVPRSTVEGEKSYDSIQVSVNQDDTSRSAHHLRHPPTFGEGGEAVFFSVAYSSAAQVAYAKEMQQQSVARGELSSNQLSRQVLCSSIEEVPDKIVYYCVRFKGVSFLPQVLQNDPDLLELIPNAIATTGQAVAGEHESEHGRVVAGFNCAGFEFSLAIDGRSDKLSNGPSVEDFLSNRVKSMTLSGA